MRAGSRLEGSLLDSVIQMLGSATRTTVRKLIKNGRVAVDGMVQTRPDFTVRSGQTLEISPRRRARPPFTILLEDDHLVAVDKPAGLLSIATGKEQHKTLYRMVTDYVRETTGGPDRIYIVHRLDRDVSGVMVFAKDAPAKLRLQERWAGAEKIYHAVVYGRPPADEGTVRNWLCENQAHRVYACDKGAPGAREAVTHYRVIKAGARYCAVEVRIETGRKHQIRVHMAGLGCPVAGDDTYGTETSCQELALHAHSLAFNHPSTGRRTTVTSRLPPRVRNLPRSGRPGAPPTKAPKK